MREVTAALSNAFRCEVKARRAECLVHYRITPMAKPYDPQDHYYRKAKAQGLRARSAFKIEEIVRRRRLLGAGQAVLDLGAAPGGFLQVLAEIVGERGAAVGVDLEPIRNLGKPWVKTAVLDLRAPPRALRPRDERHGAEDDRGEGDGRGAIAGAVPHRARRRARDPEARRVVRDQGLHGRRLPPLPARGGGGVPRGA